MSEEDEKKKQVGKIYDSKFLTVNLEVDVM